MNTSPILPITPVKLTKLEGKRWRLASKTYTFSDRRGEKTPPWRTGAEAYAMPMTDDHGEGYFAKFYKVSKTTNNEKRHKRIEYLIRQKLHQGHPAMAAAPIRWAHSSLDGCCDGIEFDFTACIAKRAPGDTWHSAKIRIQKKELHFLGPQRKQCAIMLLGALAELERRKMFHGDLSDHNVLVNLTDDRAAQLSLIDFDAYGIIGQADQALGLDEGGTYGTTGYCPPELSTSDAANRAPFSDRFGRDMLLFELLGFDRRLNPEESPQKWALNIRQFKSAYFAALLASSSDDALANVLHYLSHKDIVRLPEAERPSSTELLKASSISRPSSGPKKSGESLAVAPIPKTSASTAAASPPTATITAPPPPAASFPQAKATQTDVSSLGQTPCTAAQIPATPPAATATSVLPSTPPTSLSAAFTSLADAKKIKGANNLASELAKALRGFLWFAALFMTLFGLAIWMLAKVLYLKLSS